MSTHPAYAEEKAHLDETLLLISREQTHAAKALDRAEEALKEARRSQPDALPVREMLYARTEETLRHLKLSRRRPYFTRVDFTEKGEKNVYYIGRWGVTQSDTLESRVIDWRAPVANLYYSGQIGPMHYDAPDGRIEGELTLKRQFAIDGGKLESVFDVDLATADVMLQKALSQRTGDRLRDIVTTIQSEQNLVIRHPLGQSMVVQGAPGSGKTTVALHRIAYLLYAHPTLRPSQMVILAPSPLFLNFIAGVLPDLGVESVRQTTFEGFIRTLVKLPKCANATPDAAQRALDAQILGDAGREAHLASWLEGYERAFADRDIAFGPVRLYDREELARFLLVDEAPFPMARRLREFQKQLTARVKGAAYSMEKFLLDEAARRAEKLRTAADSPSAAQEKITKLYKSLNERVSEIKNGVKPFIKRAMGEFPSTDPLAAYLLYLEAQPGDTPFGEACGRALKRLSGGKTILREDLAPLTLIALRLLELPRPEVRHLVVDEAQDFSPLEFELLTRLAPGATMTLVGDLMQSIGIGGLTDWQAPSCLKNVARRELTVSYRSTVEIMETAEAVFRRYPAPNVAPPKTVARHGDTPVVLPVSGLTEQAAYIARLSGEWLSLDERATVAVVSADERALPGLLRALPSSLGARILTAEDENAPSGVNLVSAAAVKGLEFDAVILADAGETAFPDDAAAARLLYVCLTRPLHRLAILHKGPLTPLLSGFRKGGNEAEKTGASTRATRDLPELV